MTTEQAWHVLRTAAGVSMGEFGYHSAPWLFRSIPPERRPNVIPAALILGIRIPAGA